MNNDPNTRATVGASEANLTIKDAACAALVVLVGLPALWPYLFTRQTLYWGDIELYFAPMQSFLHQSLTRGVIPLWNPYILCGEPFVGNPQTWPLYPSTLLAGKLDPWRFLTLVDALHLLLAGAFFYGFLRGENICRRPGAILGAVCFMLGGYLVTKTQFPNMAQAIAWAPAILWAAGRLARAPGFWTAFWLGLALGLQLLAAHAQITLLTGYLALATVLYTAWPRLTGKFIAREWARLAAWGIAALAFACCLDAGELLPVLEVWKHSDRQILTLTTASRFTLGRFGVLGLVAPNAFGSPFDGNFHRAGNYWEPACYLGIVPLALTVVAIYHGVKTKSRESIFWSCVFALSILLALGRPGLYNLAFYCIPGVKAFHDPARMLLGAAVAGAVLAGQGLDWLLARLPTRIKNAQFAAAALIGLTVLDLSRFDRRAYPLMPLTTLESAVSNAQIHSVTLAAPGARIVYPPDNKATWRYFAAYENYHRLDSSYMPSLLATHTTNTGMLLGLADAGGYEPEPPFGSVRRYIDAYNAHENGQGSSGLNSLAVDTQIAFQRIPAPGIAAGYFASHRMTLWRNPDARTITRARLGDGRYLPVDDISPDEVAVTIPAGAAGETLRIADTEAPGWTASLRASDGSVNALSVSLSPDGLRDLTLPQSSSDGTLTMRYEPSAWRIGLFLTLLAAAYATACAVYAVSSRRRAS